MLLMKVSPFWCFFVAFSAKLFHWISYVHTFKGRIVFFKFIELFMNMFVPWCQLPHPPMVCVIVVYKNKATNAASKLF